MKATDIRNIVIHCSAGFGDKDSIERYWKGTLGWRSPGYHLLIDELGVIHELADFDKQVNGVRGYNDCSIHICYIGGVRKESGKYVAEDTRTTYQKRSIHICIQEAIEWLQENGKDITTDLGVVGHRDFSPDQNGNGEIDSWERIKECPSFDVMEELNKVYSSPDRYGLP